MPQLRVTFPKGFCVQELPEIEGPALKVVPHAHNLKVLKVKELRQGWYANVQLLQKVPGQSYRLLTMELPLHINGAYVCCNVPLVDGNPTLVILS